MKLDFSLPAFQRITWVSSELKTEWESLLQHLPTAIRSVFEHPEIIALLPVFISIVPDSDIYLKKKQFAANGIFADQTKDLTGLVGNPFAFRIPEGHSCLVAGERDRVLSLLYGNSPLSEIFAQHVISPSSAAFWERFLHNGFTDPLWAYQMQEETIVAEVISENNLLNPYLRRLGISSLPYYPDSLYCQAALGLAETIREAARDLLPQQLFDVWYETLSWPVEWSALHGIAEIKTPLFKLIYNTDAYGTKFLTQLSSSSYPINGLKGILFPYRQPKKMLLFDTERYKNGIDYLKQQ